MEKHFKRKQDYYRLLDNTNLIGLSNLKFENVENFRDLIKLSRKANKLSKELSWDNIYNMTEWEVSQIDYKLFKQKVRELEAINKLLEDIAIRIDDYYFDDPTPEE